MQELMRQTWGAIRRNKLLTCLIVAMILLEALVYPHFKNSGLENDIDVVRLSLLGLTFYLLVFAGKNHYKSFKSVITIAIPLLALGVLAYYIIDPVAADQSAREDGLVENFSAITLLVGFLAMLITSLFLLKKRNWLLGVATLLIAGLCFVISMEEISWSQRIFGIESGEFFKENNWQGETNLHNLNTYLTEQLYYFGGFFLLVLMPAFTGFIKTVLGKLNLKRLEVFIPSLWLIVPFAVMVGFTKGSDYSHYLAFLISLAATLVILCKQLVDKIDSKHYFVVIAALISLAVIVLGNLLFFKLDFKAIGIGNWRPTEYKELLIATGLMVYGFDTIFKPRGLRSIMSSAKTKRH